MVIMPPSPPWDSVAAGVSGDSGGGESGRGRDGFQGTMQTGFLMEKEGVGALVG